MDAAELARLAANRPLITPELHVSNDFYSHARLLKQYAGLSPVRPLKLAIEHAVTIEDATMTLDLNSRMPIYLCTSERRAADFDSRVENGKAFPIGPMIDYVPDRDAAPPERSLLLVVPGHSTEAVNTTYEVESFAARIDELRGDFDDVAVCVYWRDVQRGVDAEYRRLGFDCACAGHIYDPEFLSRLRRFLLSADLVVTNEIGTHLPYAVHCGARVWLVDQAVTYDSDASILERDYVDPAGQPVAAQIRELFSKLEPATTPAQREFIAELLGSAHVRTPEQIRELVALAERRYRDAFSFGYRMARHGYRRLRYEREYRAARRAGEPV